MAGTDFFTPISSTCEVAFTKDAGGVQVAMFAKCTGVPPTTANKFGHGCLIIRTDSGSGNPSLYENTGTFASPVWNLVGQVTPGEIPLTNKKIIVGNSSNVGATFSELSVESIALSGLGSDTPLISNTSTDSFSPLLLKGKSPSGQTPLVFSYSSDAGANGPALGTFHDSASPAINDVVGSYSAFGRNDAGSGVSYLEERVVITNVTAGAIASQKDVYLQNGGSFQQVVSFGFNGSSSVMTIGDGNATAGIAAQGLYDLALIAGTGKKVLVGDSAAVSASGGAASSNTQHTLVTTESLTTAADATYTLTLSNTKIASGSIVQVTLSLGTATTGRPVVEKVTPGSNQVVIVVRNFAAAAALNGTLTLAVSVVA